MLKKVSQLSTVLLFVIGVTGCSSAPKYYDSSSFARNILMADGLTVNDRTEPKGGVGGFTQTVEFGAAYTAAGFIEPALNLSNLAGGMVNLLDVLIDDGPNESRSSILGWMPASQAKDRESAAQQIVSHVKDSITTALESYELNYTELKTGDATFIAYHISNKELGCPAEPKSPDWLHYDMWNVKWLHPGTCVVRAQVKGLRERKPPVLKIAKHSEEEAYWLLGSYKNGYNAIQIASPKNSSLKQNLLYTKISENLPEWMYIYLAPNTVSLGEDGKKIGFPYVLNQGEAHFFIRPQ